MQITITVEGPYIPNLDLIADGIVAELDKISQDIKRSEESVMENWVNKAQVVIDRQVSRASASFHIHPTGENAKYWAWVSLGVKARHISPKTSAFLAFKYQGPKVSYIPKTYPGQGWGGPGQYMGNVQKFFDGVNWPGIEPRDFEGQIWNAYKPTYDVRLGAAFDKALTQVKASMRK